MNDDTALARLVTGEIVGRYAMNRYDDGVEVKREHWDIAGAETDTKTYIEAGNNTIFEAAAVHPTSGDYARIDILNRIKGSDEWELSEVKSSGSIKEHHLKDLAFQYYVFKAAGYNIRTCRLIHVDNSYKKKGSIEPHRLLQSLDVTDKIIALQKFTVFARQSLAKSLSENEEPEEAISRNKCRNPNVCEFTNHCWEHVPEYSVYDVLTGKKLDEVVSRHGLEIGAIPHDKLPSGRKALEIKSFLNNEIIIDAAAIREFLAKLKYPLYFLDYETINPTIPVFDGTRPFQQVPFQFSLHIQEAAGSALVHHEYLHQAASDPRHGFAAELVSKCGSEGTVIVYNQSFEEKRNEELSADLPEYSEALSNINARMIDLLIPFRSKWLYHPSQKGSASIKAVLPAFSDMTYDDLEIADGGAASSEYMRFLNGEVSESALPELWSNLSRYCQQDTLAMVKLLHVLNEHAGN